MAQEIADSKLLDTWGSGGTKIEPDISKIIEGWQLGEQPPHEYMNWLQNTFGSKLNHILKNGVAKWDGETEYLAGASVQHNGNVWLCETTNTNSEPTDLNANWGKVAINKDLTVTVDTLDDLRSVSYPANTVWASGYHTKNDGAFGSHIFRLKGVKTTETDNGGTVIIATIGGTDYVYELQYDGAVNVKWFGAVGDGVTDDTFSFQNASTYANSIGGAIITIPTPPVAWKLSYPVYLFNNTHFIGSGKDCKIIYKNPSFSKGRGGFVIGSSVECNRDTAMAEYALAKAQNRLPTATTYNSAFVNPVPYQYLDANPQFIQSVNSSIENIYLIASHDVSTDWGGYGINIINSVYCYAKNIWGEGWTQLVGMGSDVAPETPGNYRCHASNLYVIKPDLVHTYYSIGFIANSLECSISDGYQYMPMTTGSADGSGVATAFGKKLTIRNIYIDNLGDTVTSEGVLVNASISTIVENINIGGARKAVVDFTSDKSIPSITYPNVYNNINIKNSINGMCFGWKYAIVNNLNTKNVTNEVSFISTNATYNTVTSNVNTIYFTAGRADNLYLLDNDIKGWQRKTEFIRPMQLLVNPQDTLYFNVNKSITAKNMTPLYLMYKLPVGIKAINAVEIYATFADNSQANNSSISIQLRRMVAFNGNTGETPNILASTTRTSTYTTTTDVSVVMNAYTNITGGTGLKGSEDILIFLTNPTNYSTLKEVMIEYFA